MAARARRLVGLSPWLGLLLLPGALLAVVGNRLLEPLLLQLVLMVLLWDKGAAATLLALVAMTSGASWVAVPPLLPEW
jgi:hypothetical protein